jgi:hypothetical protein
MKHAIKTFEDACAALKISTYLPDFSTSPEHHQKALIAHYKLVIINEALNEGWKPNWGDWNESKYFPWFDFQRGSDKSSGFGFSYFVWTYSLTGTDVGARLCFKSAELAKYAGKQFEELYKDYFLLE